MQNLEQTIISQYGNSPVLNQLLQNMNEYLDPATDLDAFYATIFDIDTAVGYGLDAWGKIVGVGRQIAVAQADFFGFKGSFLQPFGQAPFYSGPSAGTYLLSDTAYRLLILVKALSNISDCSIPSYNRLLQNLFAGRGRCYAVDLAAMPMMNPLMMTMPMQMQFTFEFYLQPYEWAIITQSGAFPRPAGVQLYALQADVNNTFGFAGSGLQPFGQGTFSQRPQVITN